MIFFGQAPHASPEYGMQFRRAAIHVAGATAIDRPVGASDHRDDATSARAEQAQVRPQHL
jgi:hypothetical protein